MSFVTQQAVREYTLFYIKAKFFRTTEEEYDAEHERQGWSLHKHWTERQAVNNLQEALASYLHYNNPRCGTTTGWLVPSELRLFLSYGSADYEIRVWLTGPDSSVSSGRPTNRALGFMTLESSGSAGVIDDSVIDGVIGSKLDRTVKGRLLMPLFENLPEQIQQLVASDPTKVWIQRLNSDEPKLIDYSDRIG